MQKFHLLKDKNRKKITLLWLTLIFKYNLILMLFEVKGYGKPFRKESRIQ
jgi:hypothetical protein